MNFDEMMKKAPYNLNEEQIKWVIDTMSKMTMEQKIRQMFCTIAYTDNENYLAEIAAGEFGGLMCRTMPSKAIVNLVNYMQKNSKIPVFVAGNMEAGMNTCAEEGTHVGCQMAIAATKDVHYASKLGRIVGEEAGVLGMNWAFAPVIDIDYNWRNPITNTRTYGSDPELVAKMGAAYVKEVQKCGVAASIKHFPGDGVDERDQHLVTSVNSLSTEEWMNTYGKVYKASIEAGALTVMAGHIMQPAWSKKLNPELEDKDILPGSMSYELLTGLLREELGFNGTIITDSSAMAGMTTPLPRRKGLPAAINAGCDMILFAKNMEEDLGYLRDAIERGEISKERVEECVTRILALKAALRLPEKQESGAIYPSIDRANEIVNCEDHDKVSKKVATKSITLLKEEKGVFPITPDRYKRVLVYPKESGGTDLAFGAETRIDAFATRMKKEGFQVTVWKPSPGFEGIVAPMADIIENYDIIIYLANYVTKSNQTVVRIEWAQPMGADCLAYVEDMPNVFISLENPYHLVDVPRVRTYINTYGSTENILDALIEKLTGRSEFEGVSPVDAFCGFWDAHLS